MTINVIEIVLVPALTSLAVSGLLVWFLREWIGVRIRAGVQHEYDRKLEALKTELKVQHEVALLDIKTAIARETSLYATAHASFAEGQKASMERKLDAIDQLWSNILKLRTSLPPLLGFMDVLTVDEYKDARDHPTFQAYVKGASLEEINESLGPHVEETRPYVGEYLWTIFFCYRAILLRILFLLQSARTDVTKMEWHKDKGIRQLLGVVLAPAEVVAFDGVKIGKISWIQQRLESKMLAAAQKVISGETFAAESLEQAKQIQERVESVNLDQRREREHP